MDRLQPIWRWIRQHPFPVILFAAVVLCLSTSEDVTLWVTMVGSAVAWFVFRHPFWAVPLFTAFMLMIEEFYPFSNFPMYGDPDESENYFYVAEVVDPKSKELRALPVETLTRITAPKVKKMFKSRRDARAEELGIKWKEMSKDQLAAVGTELIAYLREREGRTDETLPDQLALVEVWIRYDEEKGFSETPEIVVYDPPLK